MLKDDARAEPAGCIETIGRRPVVLMNSVTHLAGEHAGAIVVSGSHGGLSSAQFVRAASPYLVVVSDAGVGKEQAGVAGLSVLDGEQIAAVAVDHRSAMIGEAEDAWEHGTISHLNAQAAALGLRVGEPVQAEIRRALAAEEEAAPA